MGRAAVTALLVGAASVTAPVVTPLVTPLAAQVNLPPPPPADTTPLDFDLPSARWRQTLVVRGTVRRYDVDERTGTDYGIAERAGLMSYTLRGARLSLRADLLPLRYTATPAGGAATALTGLTPAQVRLDWRWRDGDTTRLYVRSGTQPAVLDTAQSRALGAAGTSTLDLDAMAFGVQAVAGVRQTVRVAVDEDNAFGFRGAVETSPQPTGADFAYWTGTTLRGGVSWQRALGPAASARVGADVARSFAGDLGGRNLFPGGGSVVVDARASGLLDGEDGRWFGAVQATWTRPFANPNADNLARLIPQGQFGGVNALLSADVGPVSIGPTLSVLREASSADARFLVANPLGGRPLSNTVRKVGSGWSAAVGLTATWSVLDALELTLDGAVTRGGVDLRETERLLGPGGRPIGSRETRRENAIAGGWLALDVALRW
ncbi:MAG: hypothetical protein MUF53_05235 [Gemmatimonadaceae bacterium]|nr:hypothetical protein [Gemmatimonadaceae bacterium]